MPKDKKLNNNKKSQLAAKGPRGKYKQWLTKEGLLKIESWAREGLTDEQISTNMGISRATLSDWKNKYVDISDTLKRGKEVVDIQVENALLKRALGYSYKEVRIEKSEEGTKTIETTKEVAPDTTAQIFWLKNRRPDKWRDKQDVSLEGNVKTQTTVDLTKFTKEELLEIIGDDN